MPTLEQEFLRIFGGNPEVHYEWRHPKKYKVQERGITEADVTRHLDGKEPGLLCVPILKNGNTVLVAGDADRHNEGDEPINYAKLAKRITELNLPIVLTRSKTPTSAHLWLVFKDEGGFNAAIARQLMAHYIKLLEIEGKVEIFPKQEKLEDGDFGSGINVPFFGGSRIGFDEEGNEIKSVKKFLALVEKRASFGDKLADRDLTNASEPEGTATEHTNKPLPIEVIRAIHLKHVKDLAEQQPGGRNDFLNLVSFFAGRAYAGKALEESDVTLQAMIKKAASTCGMESGEIDSTFDSGWTSGIKKPIKILDPEKAETEAKKVLKEYLEDKKELVWGEVISYLALLSEEEFELGGWKAGCAKKLKTDKVTLDGFVKKKRIVKKKDLQGRDVIVDDPEPWHEKVDLAALLDEITKLLKTYIVFQRESDMWLLSLWVLVTYCAETFSHAPMIGVTAEKKGCGKTSLMRILVDLVWKGLPTAACTKASALRLIAKFNPCLVADEIDKWLRNNPEMIEIFLVGHEKKFAFVHLCVGDANEVRAFYAYGPKIWAQIGTPDDQLTSRSVIVRLPEKRADQPVTDWPRKELPAAMVEQFSKLRKQCKRWVQDSAAALKSVDPDVALENRVKDNWYPLFCVAKLAGEKWQKRAVEASASGSVIDEDSPEMTLLKDIRNIFSSRGIIQISSEMLLEDLKLQKESSWASYENGRPLNVCQLASLLKKKQVFPGDLWLDRQYELYPKEGKANVRGYKLEWFKELFDMYLSNYVPRSVPTAKVSQMAKVA